MRCPNIRELPPAPPGKTGWPWTAPSGASTLPWLPEVPRISVVTPCYNGAAFLEEAIRSVLLQGYPDVELIVIDGGSTDGSVDIIKRYESWMSHWVTEPDSGQSNAINKGFSVATGDWWAWLNCDDVYLPDALLNVAHIRSEHQSDWIVGTTLYVDNQLKETGRFVPRDSDERVQWADYVSGSWLDFVCSKWSGLALPQPSSFWSRRASLAAGPLDESLRFAMDHDHSVRLAHEGFRPTIVNIPLAAFRRHGAQKTALGESVFWSEELLVVDKFLSSSPRSERRVLASYRVWLEAESANLKRRELLAGLPLVGHLSRLGQRLKGFLMSAKR